MHTVPEKNALQTGAAVGSNRMGHGGLLTLCVVELLPHACCMNPKMVISASKQVHNCKGGSRMNGDQLVLATYMP